MKTKQIPPAIEGMVTISKDAFFATLGQLDVHPRIVNQYNYDNTFGYKNEWVIQRTREVVGVSNGGTYLSETRHMVTKAFYEKNKAAIEAATKKESA